MGHNANTNAGAAVHDLYSELAASSTKTDRSASRLETKFLHQGAANGSACSQTSMLSAQNTQTAQAHTEGIQIVTSKEHRVGGWVGLNKASSFMGLNKVRCF
jgi:hypothetical protein